MHLDEAAEVQISLKPGGGLASLKLGNRGLASMMDTYSLMYTPKIWTMTDERNLKLAESAAEVSAFSPWPRRLAFHSIPFQSNPQYKNRHMDSQGVCMPMFVSVSCV